MPALQTLLVFVTACVALAIVPGPAVVYIVTRSASQGVHAGLISVLGIAVGTIVHIGAAIVGLSALLQASAVAFELVKLAGAAYLIYLGIQKFRERGTSEVVAESTQSLRKTFVDAVIVNVLNPKTALFFLAFLPPFVDPARGSAPQQILVLGLIMMVVCSTSDSLFAIAGARLLHGVTARRFKYANEIVGSIYIALGITALVAGRSKN